MNIEYLRTICHYNYDMHRKVWDCIMRLTDEQFVQDVDYSLGSVRNQYVHVASVDNRWLGRLQGSPTPEGLKNEDYTTREVLRARWDQIALDMRNYVDSITDRQLDEVVHYDMPHRGGMKHNSRWQMIVHVVNHGTDHRAQVLPILHRLGAPTLEQDLILYLWE